MHKSPFAALALLLSMVLAACGATSTPSGTSEQPASVAAEAASAAPAAEGTAASEAPAAAAPAGAVPITVFSPQGPETDLATNLFTVEAQEKFGIQFTWQTTTMDGASAKE